MAQVHDFELTELQNRQYPTDMGNFPKDKELTPDTIKFIIEHGPCRPKGPFPKDDKKHCFSEAYYKITVYTHE